MKVLPKTITAVSGDQVNFTCTGDSIPASEVEWKKGNETIDNGNIRTSGNLEITSQLIVQHVAYKDRGDYSCVFRNYRGNASSTAHLFVNGRSSQWRRNGF